MPCLVLDAMGVIFEAADDVDELLIPFISEKSGTRDESIIQSVYESASLGSISADEFWHRVGVAARLEGDYLERHSLNQGIMELLSLARHSAIPVWCLSNDIGRWSQKLRQRLGVESFLQGSIISGDVGVRKPDPGIYQALVQACGYPIDDLLFVDDRVKNAQAAQSLGIDTILFDPKSGFDKVRSWILRQPV